LRLAVEIASSSYGVSWLPVDDDIMIVSACIDRQFCRAACVARRKIDGLAAVSKLLSAIYRRPIRQAIIFFLLSFFLAYSQWSGDRCIVPHMMWLAFVRI